MTQNKCSECDEGFVNVDGECHAFADCKNRESGKCVKCNDGYLLKHDYCSYVNVCDGAFDANGKCEKCIDGYEKNKDGYCVSIPPGASAAGNTLLFLATLLLVFIL